MSDNMMQVMVTALISLCVILTITAISVPVYLASRDNNEPSLKCISSGKTWVIDEASDVDDPHYECV